MDEMDRRHAEAEAIRQQHELERQAAEHVRNSSEGSRVSAEDGRRTVALEVNETIETLTTLLHRMEAVEALRREARKDSAVAARQGCSTGNPGLRQIRLHDLRHTFALLLLQQGESVVNVKEQLGHASIQITVDTYGHLIPGANRNAVDRLDDEPAAPPFASQAHPDGPAPRRAFVGCSIS